jgi:hypothetical protein
VVPVTRAKRYPGLEREAARQRRQEDEERATRVAGSVVLGALAVFIGGPLVAAAVVYLPLAETFEAVRDWYVEVVRRAVR